MQLPTLNIDTLITDTLTIDTLTMHAAPRAVRYADLGGINEVLSDIRELIELPLRHPEVKAGALSAGLGTA